jgi:hypothetical protein
LQGIRKYGTGKWKEIALDESYSFHDRTTVDLKDKWRNLQHKRDEYDRILDEKDRKGGKKRVVDEDLEEVCVCVCVCLCFKV